MRFCDQYPRLECWHSSFERDTFTLAFADFVRVLMPILLRRSDVRKRFESALSERVLAEFDLDQWGELSVVAVHPEQPRFALRLIHPEFELMSQVVLSPGLSNIEALRIAEFSGNPSAALAWSRIMICDFPQTRAKTDGPLWTVTNKMDLQ